MANATLDLTKWWRESIAGVIAIAAAAGGYYITPVSRGLGLVLYAVVVVDILAYLLVSGAKRKSVPSNPSAQDATIHE